MNSHARPAAHDMGALALDRATLDEAALARLGELDPTGATGLVERVLKTYALSLERLVDDFARARADGRHDVLRRVAHTLKSSSASVGATEFAALCVQVEAAMGVPQTPESSALLDALMLESQRVARAVQARLAID